MELFSKAELKNLFKKYQISPSKRLGQNFLIDKKVARKIIKTAQLSENDIVLEVGPGIGNLTRELAKEAKKVIAIEKAPQMVEVLKETANDFKNIEIVQGDILKIENWKLKIENSYKVVANIPYYLTSPLIRKFLETKRPPKTMVLMVQKEVAQRICSIPPKMNLLAVSVQFYAKPEIISYVSKKSFWPQPKVDSAIIKLTTYSKQLTSINVNLFFKVVKAGFSQPRKQLANNLSKMLKLEKEETKSWLLKNNIDPERRAETLSLDDWIDLTKSFIIK